MISGGRPALAQRPTHRLLEGLREYGVHDVVWVVKETHAHEYARDEHPVVTYSETWAYEYARKHWMHPVPPEKYGFLGAFPGREWACLEAERRGCWGVLQLDDNISHLGIPNGTKAALGLARRHGELTLYADLLAAVALSTNGREVGAALLSVPTIQRQIARPGYPYSLFIEKVGEGREPWYGPFEDDITHAFQYGNRPDADTTLLVPLLRYRKESTSTSGMRGKYDHTRSVQLQRMFPETAKIGVNKTRSNGRGTPRVFHRLSSTGIRTPLQIRDAEMFDAVKSTLEQLLREWKVAHAEAARAKVYRRTENSA